MTAQLHNANDRKLLLIIADGVRHDVLAEELDGGQLPALAALRESGGFFTVSTCFPSVTGPGYVPFLTGRFPAAVGVPGLRWFDRAGQIGLSRGQARSYAGIDIWHLDNDLHSEAKTLFEIATPSLSAMSMLGRGAQINIGRSVGWMLRFAPSHFRGNFDDWRRVEQVATRQFLQHFERMRPRFATLAVTSPDKRAHKEGPYCAGVRATLGDVDNAVAQALAIATRGGWRDALDIWLVGDHGHSPVAHHDDLHSWLEKKGLRVRAHPKVLRQKADVALMVGGNAMAHLYFEPGLTARPVWPALQSRWQSLHDELLSRESVDLLAVSMGNQHVRVSNAARGSAEIVQHGIGPTAHWDYTPTTGDPLQLGGPLTQLDFNAAWFECNATEYPDALVQLSALLSAPRSGDIVISAAKRWDLRSRFEPVPHVSTHGALLRDQMMVPLIISRPVARTPRRTADVMPSALTALGFPVPVGLDGQSFL